MLETVDELHARMGGLPSAEIVERLAQSIQKKADRAEMDRLEKLLAAVNSGSTAPVGSLMKAPMKCLSCDQSLPYVHSGAGSPERNGASRFLQPPTSCSHNHHQQTPELTSYYIEPSLTTGEDAEAGSLRDLFGASSTAASRRRKQRELNASVTSFTPNNWLESNAAHTRPSFVNLDDGRNRIPLRRTVLSDQVVYGPAITPNAFKRRAFASALSRFDSYEYVEWFLLQAWFYAPVTWWFSR